MKKESESSTTVTKAFAIGRDAVLNELHAQVASGNITKETAKDILNNLFEEG